MPIIKVLRNKGDLLFKVGDLIKFNQPYLKKITESYEKINLVKELSIKPKDIFN